MDGRFSGTAEVVGECGRGGRNALWNVHMRGWLIVCVTVWLQWWRRILLRALLFGEQRHESRA